MPEYVCSCCGDSKDKSLFFKNKTKKKGINSNCKECCKNKSRTIEGVIYLIYKGQKSSFIF